MRQNNVQALAAWRKDQEKELTDEGGWLSVVGLVWLSDGENRLPAPLSALGVVVRKGTTLQLRPPSGEPTPLPDPLAHGSVTGKKIVRGQRIGIRIYDSESAARKKFAGRQWFPPVPSLLINATFHAYNPPKQLPITNVLGDTQPVVSPGYVTFTIGGKACRLEAQETPTGLFFNFRDLTNGKTTYPAGRFLDTEKPKDGKVVLDFNRATSPPCAFTEFATCPLPPKANYLAVAIPAGERGTHHG